MLNILEVQDNLKNFSQDQLVSEMQSPSGQAPQFLVLSELSRREKMKQDLNRRMAQDEPTVAEESIVAAGFPQGGIMDMARSLSPKSSIAQNTGINSLPMKTGGVIKAQNGLPLGIRNFNPGNLRKPSGDPFLGTSGMDSGYLTFSDPNYGLRALARNLMTYQDEYGIDNVNSLVDRYAPPSDNPEKSRENYKLALSNILGINPDEQFNIKEKMPQLMEGIIKFENKNQMPYSSDQLSTAIDSASIDDELEVANMLLEKPDVPVSKPVPDATGGVFDVLPSSVDQEKIIIPGSEQFKKEKTEIIPRSELQNKITENLKYRKDDGRNPLDFFDESKQLPDETLAQSIAGDLSFSDLFQGSMFSDGGGGYANRPSISDDPKRIQPQIISRDLLGNYESQSTGLGEGQTTGESNETESESSDVNEQVDGLLTTPIAESGTSSLEKQILGLMERRTKSAEADKWLALAQAGLAIMGSDKPTLGGAIGEGGLVGLQAMADANARYEEGLVDLINAQAKLNKASPDLNKVRQRYMDVMKLLGQAQLSDDGLNLDQKINLTDAQLEQLQILARNLENQLGLAFDARD
tara:strand:+ start:1826 stop:3565 length:1740 start_codon:yes stop_codon:yes gene_type:complete